MITRRRLLGGALAALPLTFLWRRGARAGGFGPLIADPEGILDLPAGFSYRVVERAGTDMTDGYRVPGRPDGMACFAGAPGTLVLMRNHELSSTDGAIGPYHLGQAAPLEAYAAAELGGVTRVVVDATTGERISSNLVLTGTVRNCAGGVSPWGWLTCEETSNLGHGWVFACAPDADGVRPPQRIPAYGRFEHEAAAVDPATMIAYLTEDAGDSCFYRFVPDSPAAPHLGALQALRVVGTDRFDTANGNQVGDSWTIDWVDIPSPDPQGTSCRAQGHAVGAAYVKRGEGLWIAGGAVYFASTTGGPASKGQIFRLDPDGDGGTLTLIAQSNSGSQLDMPDNLTVASWGDVYMAEDGPGDNYIRILGTDGSISDFARNALSDSEVAGVCFSPDERILFVNIQNDGLTLAITGPFPVEDDDDDDDGGVPDAGPDEPTPDAGPDDAEPDGGGGGGPGIPDDDDGAGCNASDGGSTGGAVVIAAAAAALARLKK